MKRNIIFYGILLSIALYEFSCSKKENSPVTISASEQELLQGMKDSYENARLYNDTLESIVQSVAPDEYEYCDSAYNYYVNCFDSLHDLYPHNNEDADHYHDHMGMHMMQDMMKSMMGSTPWVDGHHSIEHDMMDELESDHDAMLNSNH